MEGSDFLECLLPKVTECLKEIEEASGKRYGSPNNPLLILVRSGAAVSMPGMMDTVLNLGLNEDTVEGLARRSHDERFTHDCYRRLIQMFGEVVLKVDGARFEGALEALKGALGANEDRDLGADALRHLVSAYRRRGAVRGPLLHRRLLRDPRARR
jgi:pyruvate,orthophosphate dikinase